ncbi:histidine kinase [Clostridium novyi A str. 4552]|uniref:histidine kinase n=1 Tax=Clostridium novyi A str. 4552 TaxID=1444289 RepID=A0A0A0I1B5_CLONO|nr:HAMP domain-containing sensor histidine kinase [Clostridium novyi]KGM95184.1 histidine kinase [Clostridium novyi A str. 4552]
MKDSFMYLKNPEMKIFITKFLVCFILGIVTFSSIFYRNTVNLNKLYINQNTLIIGNILAKDPNLEKEIISAFNTKYNSNYDLGKRVLEKYCYDEELSIARNSVISDFCYNILVEMCILIFIIGFIMFIISFKEFFKFYNKMDKFAEVATEVVDGNFNRMDEDYKEGTISIFTNKFNLMIERIENSMYELKKEKIFLKNIIQDISHQLKTPLSSLMMFNEIILNDKTSNDDKKYFLKLSYEQLSRMEWLIVNLLKLGRIEAGVVEFNINKSPIYITVNKALFPLIQKAQQKDIEISLDLNKEIIFDHDIDWTAEAISNIIKNSIEHTQNGGRIKVRVEETPLSVSICIEDNGEGIPKDKLGVIFDRFYKSENSTNPMSIGIGLSITKSIIESQNGSISVKSIEKEGTKFIITFLKQLI